MYHQVDVTMQQPQVQQNQASSLLDLNFGGPMQGQQQQQPPMQMQMNYNGGGMGMMHQQFDQMNMGGGMPPQQQMMHGLDPMYGGMGMGMPMQNQFVPTGHVADNKPVRMEPVQAAKPVDEREKAFDFLNM
jgi:hypothetical protein